VTTVRNGAVETTMLQRSMTPEIPNEALLSDADLLNEVKRLTALERQATSRLIAALGELDARRLYLGEGCSSLFTYCTQVLHLSEHAAYLRIEAARVARKWPLILELLADGALHLTAIGLLAPHLTADNHERVLAAARHRSKREVEEIVAALRPQSAVPSSVRKLPVAKASAPAKVDSQPTRELTGADLLLRTRGIETTQPVQEPHRDAVEIRPLAPERYKVQFTVSSETHQKLREAQNLLRHCIPDGDVATIFERALTLLVNELHKAKHALADHPRVTSPHAGVGRHIPASVKRQVWERDQGQCAFVGAVGRCSERGFLEYHHRIPFSDGGATNLDNLELRCRAHNAFEAERWFGVQQEDLVREAREVF
jgi:5-methylcytosine-specific restriction endonuclease McrA